MLLRLQPSNVLFPWRNALEQLEIPFEDTVRKEKSETANTEQKTIRCDVNQTETNDSRAAGMHNQPKKRRSTWQSYPWQPYPWQLVSSGQADGCENGQRSHCHDETYGRPPDLLRNVAQHCPLQRETHQHL